MILMIGRGGHAAVVADALDEPIDGWVLRDGEMLEQDESSESQVLAMERNTRLLNGLGFTGGTNHRRAVFEKFVDAGFEFEIVVHPHAFIGSSVSLGAGAQILVGSIVNVGATVGLNSIVNTGAVVEHHVSVGDHCHVAPNATICGGAVVADGALIGAGAVVLGGVVVEKETIVGSGAVVTKSFPSGSVLVGCPARAVTE